MNISIDDFRRHFELLSDAALQETNREELVETARVCFDDELARRGLNVTIPVSPEVSATDAEGATSHVLSAGEELVVIGTFSVADEASLARGLLESASIPARLENMNLGLGAFQLRLLVPAAFEEQALEVLDYEISDEELAAQAEAAGEMEPEPEEVDTEN